MKKSNLAKAFFMGVGFHYLMTHKSRVLSVLFQEIYRESERARIESERVVDPYNRTVE